MDQATAGNARGPPPPPIATNSPGGRIQISNMNMNAVGVAAPVGSVPVVPSLPGVAQSVGTMVGSPGPHWRGRAMAGPRMLRTPQMLPPLTRQALSGLPPWASHILVQAENGEFGLVRIGMQSPTAAAASTDTRTPTPSSSQQGHGGVITSSSNNQSVTSSSSNNNASNNVKSQPHIRHSLATNEKIDGIKRPPPSTFVSSAPVTVPPTPSACSTKAPPVLPKVPANPVRITTPTVNSASPSTPATSALTSAGSKEINSGHCSKKGMPSGAKKMRLTEEEPAKTVHQLKKENDALKCQLEASKNELDLCKVDLRSQLERKDQQLRSFQQQFADIQSKGLHNQASADKWVKLACMVYTFLRAHPFGVSLDYISSYAQKTFPMVRPDQIEGLMKMCPSLFKQEVSGIGETLERKWAFVEFS